MLLSRAYSSRALRFEECVFFLVDITLPFEEFRIEFPFPSLLQIKNFFDIHEK